MIITDKVHKRFGPVSAVTGVSLEVHQGEIFGLVGPDGAGKTTMIRILTGILQPDDGSVRVLGSSDIEAVKADIGYVPQKFSLYSDLTVGENIRVIGALYGQSDRQISQLAEEILTFTGLLPFKHRLAEHLSGGMKQKLALAAGLMHRPKLFFLDEPTTGVDPVSRREFWRMLYRMNKEGTTVFVSTPYMDEAELCTKVAFMHNGGIAACASPEQLRSSYPHKVLELRTHTVQKSIQHYIADLTLDSNAFGSKFHLVVDDAAEKTPVIRQRLETAGIRVASLQQVSPTLEDVFVALADGVN